MPSHQEWYSTTPVMSPLQARLRCRLRPSASREPRQTSQRPPSISPATKQHSSTAPSSTSMGAEATSLRRPANHDAHRDQEEQVNSSNTIVRPGSRALQAAIAGDVFLPAAYDPDHEQAALRR